MVSDDGGSGDGGDVCEVISPLSFSIYIVCENIESFCNAEAFRASTGRLRLARFCLRAHWNTLGVFAVGPRATGSGESKPLESRGSKVVVKPESDVAPTHYERGPAGDHTNNPSTAASTRSLGIAGP